jgi:hypothetical protein
MFFLINDGKGAVCFGGRSIATVVLIKSFGDGLVRLKRRRGVEPPSDFVRPDKPTP